MKPRSNYQTSSSLIKHSFKNPFSFYFFFVFAVRICVSPSPRPSSAPPPARTRNARKAKLRSRQQQPAEPEERASEESGRQETKRVGGGGEGPTMSSDPQSGLISHAPSFLLPPSSSFFFPKYPSSVLPCNSHCRRRTRIPERLLFSSLAVLEVVLAERHPPPSPSLPLPLSLAPVLSEFSLRAFLNFAGR